MSGHDDHSDDGLRADLGRLVRELLEETPRSGGASLIGPQLRAHLGIGEDEEPEFPVFAQELEGWELPNLQLALDAAMARSGWAGRVLTPGREARHFGELSLGSFMTAGSLSRHVGVGPAVYVNVPVGPERTLPCLDLAFILLSSPDGPIAALVNRSDEQHGGPPLSVQTASPQAGLAQRFLADLQDLMDAHDVYRGQVIVVEATRHGGHRIAFMERPVMERGELVLPDGMLERIESHVLGPTRHRDALLASRRHLSRGLLLWGPPGTGKTHTVRYLTGRLTDATIVLLSGGSLGMVGSFATLAKRLAPSLIVLEDVDLVAQERSFGPFGSSPVLFELMDQMSGLGDDADVAFVLTTNRADVLEPALAARPGRVDLAIEIPLPDVVARRKLVELYATGLDLGSVDLDRVVERTAGVTASFIRELLRRAALLAADQDRTQVTEEDVHAALDELLSTTSALTRSLLGVPGDDRESSDRLPQHAWLQAFPDNF
jgi:cell division protease FtsH